MQSHTTTALKGTIAIPGDKSISHRALMLGSQAIGTTEIHGLLESDDVIHPAEALERLGVTIEKSGTNWRVHGVGTGGLSESTAPLYMGNSGTGTRLMMGLMASYPFTTYFHGDASLSKRPMGRAMQPLKQCG